MKITISAGAVEKPLNHPWGKCITVGRAYELLRADLQEHLLFLQRHFNYRHIRFHASFHDDVAVVHKLDHNQIVYRWAQLDRIYDFLVEAGFDPIVEINPMPAALASGEDTFFWYKMNVTPPRSYVEWEAFLKAYIEHTIERYGIDRVSNWAFEVWNEPDLNGQFFTGSKEQYFELYASCARVIKGFDKGLQVGGPATAGSSWTVDLAQWCRQNSVPLDFVSYHAYPQNEVFVHRAPQDRASEPGMFFVDTVKAAKNQLVKAGFGDLPIYMTEWNTQAQESDWIARWVGNRYVNNLFAGAAVCHLAHGCDEFLDVMGWWVASDVFEEGGPQVEPFGSRFQYYGLLNFHGIPKSSFHGFKFLGRMRGKRYPLEFPETVGPTQGGIVTDEISCTRALFWNACFPDTEQKAWKFEVDIPLAESHKGQKLVRVSSAQVKKDQGSAFEYWEAMGAPPNLTAFEEEILRAKAHPAYTSTMLPVVEGKVRFSVVLEPNEFIFIETGGDLATGSAGLDEAKRQLNQALMTDI